VVSQARLLKTVLEPFEISIQPKLKQFAKIAEKTYEAVALWSILHVFSARIKAEKYVDGEDFHVVGNDCVAFVDRIAQIHGDIIYDMDIKNSEFYPTVLKWFGRAMVPKCSE
jgi:hypothetical protein